MRASLLSAAVVLVVVAPAARAADPAYDQHLSAAKKAAAAGDSKTAAAAYAKAVDRAGGRPADLGRAALGLGIARGRLGEVGPAETAYVAALGALDKAPPALRPELELACNNLASLYFKAGRLKDALAVYDRLKETKAGVVFKDPEDPDTAVYQANYGRVLEQSGDRPAALAEYEKAVRTRPGYERGADLYAALLLGDPNGPRPAAARALIALLTDAKVTQAAQALKHLGAFLNAWGDRADAFDLAAAAVHFAAATGLTPAGYVEPAAAGKPARAGFQAWLTARNKVQAKTAAALLDRVFLDPDFGAGVRLKYPGLFGNSDDVWEALWNRTGGALPRDRDVLRDLAGLLVRAGDSFARAAEAPDVPAVVCTVQARQALARLTAGFALDFSDATGATRAADLLAANVGGIDPNGRVFKAFTNVLYDGKVDALREALRKSKPVKDDWVKVYSFRVTLGVLYARDKKLEGPDRYHTAIGQLELAREAEEYVQATDPLFPSSPLVAEALGKAYAANRQPQVAATAYARAAEGFAQANAPDQALLARAEALRLTTDPELKRRLDVLAALAQVKSKSIRVPEEPLATTFLEGGKVVCSFTTGGIEAYDLATTAPRIDLMSWDAVKLFHESPTFAHMTKLAAYKAGGKLFLTDPEDGPRPFNPGPNADTFARLKLSGDGGTLAASAVQGGVHLFNTKKGKQAGLVLAADRAVKTFALTDAGDKLATATGLQVTLWDAALTDRLWTTVPSPPRPAKLKLPDPTLSVLAFSADQRLLAGAGTDGRVRIWTAKDGTVAQVLDPGPAPVTALAFTSEGARLATGDAAGGVWLWDAGTGRKVGPLPSVGGGVTSLSFTPDGGTLVVGVEKSGRTAEMRLFELPAAVRGK